MKESMELTITLVLLIKLKMPAALGNPVDSVPIRESRDQGPRIFRERMKSQYVDTASEELRI